MESGGQARRNPETRAELLPKIAGKLGASVGDDVLRETMVFPYMLSEEVRQVGGAGGGSAGYKVTHFGETIDYDPNGIVPV